jgi:starvation-inducible outer membrane lipoprotein
MAAALALLLSACSTTPQADNRFGQSARAAVAAQIAQPAAARNPTPVAGMDGRAARAAQEKYEQSFGKSEAAAAPASLVGTK